LPDIEDQNATEIRTIIYQHIQNNPGIHLRKISTDLGLAMGQVQHHLSVLEESGKIKSRKINLHRHYYHAEILDKQHELILAFLTQETARDILIYLIEHPNSTQTDIANYKHFSAPTINWHMSRLIDTQIVTSKKEGKTVRYSIKGDVKILALLLKNYHPNIWNKLTSRFADLFFDLSSVKKEEADKP
jgi:predicted transcriptional regulator